MKKLIIFITLIILLAITGFFLFNGKTSISLELDKTSFSVPNNTSNLSENKLQDAPVNIYDFAEVSKHNTKEDCWTIIENKVYDISPYIALNVHGKTILSACGKDATSIFNRGHSQKSKDKLNNYYLAEISI
jgi:cytochrome b involved in lipid metabolism